MNRIPYVRSRLNLDGYILPFAYTHVHMAVWDKVDRVIMWLSDWEATVIDVVKFGIHDIRDG